MYEILAEADNSDFTDKIRPQKVFPVSKRKSEHHRWIPYVRISLDIKFQLKLTILIFWTKFSQKGYFRSKTENVNTTMVTEMGHKSFVSCSFVFS